jgi:hypothetical protein
MSMRAFARKDALALLVLSCVGALMALSTMTTATCIRNRQVARQCACAENLRLLGRGVLVYCREWGDSRLVPFPTGRGTIPAEFNGAEWLASLYWSRVISQPDLFLCPGADDTNHRGGDLGSRCAPPSRFGSQTVSYAGMHSGSLTTTEHGATAATALADMPPSLPMTCDDTQGTINHGSAQMGGMTVLFFDQHVEFRTTGAHDGSVHVERAVGLGDHLLRHLRN